MGQSQRPAVKRLAVEQGLERREVTPIPHVGIDENSFGRGRDYIMGLTDIGGSILVDEAPERVHRGFLWVAP